MKHFHFMLGFLMEGTVWGADLGHSKNSVAKGKEEGTKAPKRKTRMKGDLNVLKINIGNKQKISNKIYVLLP